MQQRPRWQRAVENLSVGQLVIIRQDNLPPTKWLLGRIEAIHPGTDGLVRVATVRTQNSTLKRPVVKLCPLPWPQLPELPSDDFNSSFIEKFRLMVKKLITRGYGGRMFGTLKNILL